MNILDQTMDINGQETYRLLTLYPAPVWVKNASDVQLYGYENMSSAEYADPVRRYFPTHTKAATWLSTLFFLDKQVQLNKDQQTYISTALEKRANFYGIKQEVNRLKESFTKTGSAKTQNDDFALIVDYADGTVDRLYPLRNPLEVKAAADYLHQYRDIIPWDEKQKMAQKILDKATLYGASLEPHEQFVEKQAGYGVCPAEAACALLMSRVASLRSKQLMPELQNELTKMAEACIAKSDQVRHRDSLMKLAGIVDSIDRATGLHKEKDYVRPEDVLFGISTKEAESFLEETVTSVTGNMYKLADLNRVGLEDIRDVFGDEFAEQISYGGLMTSAEKLAEQISTLPRPDAALLDKLLMAAGVTPIAKQAQEEKLNWRDREQLRAIARS